MTLTQQKDRVRAFIKTALNRWATSGFDDGRGTFVETLDFETIPNLDINRRGRVQARQIYVCTLANLWGFDPDGIYLEIAKRAWERAAKIYLTEEGGWVFSASPSGIVVDNTCYVYERAFTIMALTALYQATGDSEYSAGLDIAWNWLTSKCAAQHGGFNLSVPFDPTAPREQNPHMHLFEACMDARDLSGGVWSKQADELFQLAVDHFITPSGVLLEFFTQDWQPDPKTGANIQPGHLMEWTWLLTQYAKRSGKVIPQIEHLYNSACAWGLDSKGLGYDEMREGGQILRDTKRLWVQCEVIKAHCARYETSRNPTYLARAQEALDTTFELYFLEDTGSWYDQLDSSEKNISQSAPASSLYHVFIALHEFLEIPE